MAREAGQATVELLGVVPALLVAGLVVWQLILVGHTAWVSAHAARAAARAELVGEDAAAAARSVLPRGLERGLEVETTVRAVRGSRSPCRSSTASWGGPVKIAARASLESSP